VQAHASEWPCLNSETKFMPLQYQVIQRLQSGCKPITSPV